MSDRKDEDVLDSVKNYYGKVLQKTADLETQACVSTGKVTSKEVREALSLIHDDVVIKYYGCGLVIPEKLEKMKVLDLGSGSGRDCFAVSKLVGPEGHVTGIDMTEEQLEVARKYVDYHRTTFGYDQSNVEFVQGYIERLTDAGLKEDSFDIIISNCVVNLSPDKRAVLSEAFKVLKVGGELYFSDVYADRDLPDSVRKHKVLWGECIAGALWWKDLYKLANDIGFSVPRLVTASPIDVDRDDFKQVLGDAKFVSATFRLFKLPEKLESSRQVIYNGGISGFEKELTFDHQNIFKADDVQQADSDLATILTCSRFQDEFEYQPVTKQPCCDETQPKLETDPFQYLEQLKSKGVNPAAACCGTKKCC